MGEVVDLGKYRRDRKRRQAADKRSDKKRERVQGSQSGNPCRPGRPPERNDLLEDDPA